LSLVACATTSNTSPVAALDDEPASAGSFHTLAPGETLWDLSRQSGLSVEEIVEVNGLPSAEEVSPGQVIFLPAGALPVVDAPAPSERTEPSPRADIVAVLAWPLDGVIVRNFSSGAGKSSAYDGVLMIAPEGTRVVAAAKGEVLFAGDQGTDYGVIVVVRHEGELTSVYGHLKDVVVKKGDRVRAGQPLASVGMSGGAETPRLHFQVRRGRSLIDPVPLLPRGDS